MVGSYVQATFSAYCQPCQLLIYNSSKASKVQDDDCGCIIWVTKRPDWPFALPLARHNCTVIWRRTGDFLSSSLNEKKKKKTERDGERCQLQLFLNTQAKVCRGVESSEL